MSDLIIPIILAGGLGTRLWPMSRSSRPKQFLSFTGEESLFQRTLRRVADPQKYGPALILTHYDYRFVVAEQAQEIDARLAGVLLEPEARNTAAAIAAAAFYAASKINPEAILHILPSDHELNTDDNYWNAVATATHAARQGHLVTFGTTPLSPETGYGYIHAGAPLTGEVFAIDRFVEKPDHATAKTLLQAGSCFWNSGIFMFKAQAFLAECETLAPAIYQAAVAGVQEAVVDMDFIRIAPEPFCCAPNISVDYAIFEHTACGVILPTDFQWSDLGSWDAVWRASSRNGQGNAAIGSAQFSNTTNSLVVSDKALVAIDGMDDLAIIASEDAIYVGKLSQAQRVGGVATYLRQQPETRQLTEAHQTVYRPWGFYTSILQGERFQVKRLMVKPGKSLSLQLHHHRSEHWIIVKGTAEATLDDAVLMLQETQSLYIQAGQRHRLKNPGRIPLELIEVQTGSYLCEDDIMRLEDEFGRV